MLALLLAALASTTPSGLACPVQVDGGDPPSAAVDGRAPLPDAASVRGAMASLRPLLDEVRGEAADEYIALVLAEADSREVGAPAHLGLLEEAQRAATEGRYVELVFDIVARVVADYRVDGLERSVAALTALAPEAVAKRESARATVLRGLALSEEALARDAVQPARAIVDAIFVCRRKLRPAAGDGPLRARCDDAAERVEALEAVAPLLERATAGTLESDDRLNLGLYYAEWRRAFGRALELFAGVELEALAKLASDDLGAPESASTRAELGDGWSLFEPPATLARRDDLIAFARQRAAEWYRAAQVAGIDSPLVQGSIAAKLADLARAGYEPAGPDEPAPAVADGGEPDPARPAAEPGGSWRPELVPALEAQRRHLKRELGSKAVDAASAGADWLRRHQADNGSWSPGGHVARCEVEEGPSPCTGLCTNNNHRVGVTALAVRALLRTGDVESAEAIEQGLRFLLKAQLGNEGRFGAARSTEWIYDHALATLVVAEALGLGIEALRDPCRAAVVYGEGARNPFGGWRYSMPPDGQNDWSVTGWMVQALTAARSSGIEVSKAALEGGLVYLRDVTDRSGRVHYRGLGERSSRPSDLPAKQFPRELSEALTASGLLSRFLVVEALGPKVLRDGDRDLAKKARDLIGDLPPEWDVDRGSIDLYYWWLGTEALAAGHSRVLKHSATTFKGWRRSLEDALIPAQVRDRRAGCAIGSWEPVGVWGVGHGRVYSTAVSVLALTAAPRRP